MLVLSCLFNQHVGEGGATRSCGAKRFFCHYRKTKNGKELLLGQQLHLTIKQTATKMDNIAFLDSEIIIVIGFSHVWSNNPSR